jgi:hypothetical protein
MNWLKRNKILALLLIIAFGGYSGYKYVYKPHKSIEESSIEFTGNSTEFLSKIKEDTNTWNSKIIELSGKITSIDTDGVTLNEQIYCQFKDVLEVSTLKENQTIKIKGRVIGYDDLLDELKLEQCIIK